MSLDRLSDDEFVALWKSDLSWRDMRAAMAGKTDRIRARAAALGLPLRSVAGYGVGNQRGAAMRAAIAEGVRRHHAKVRAAKRPEAAAASTGLREQIDAAVAAGRVTRCPPGWHLGYEPTCIGG